MRNKDLIVFVLLSFAIIMTVLAIYGYSIHKQALHDSEIGTVKNSLEKRGLIKNAL